MTFDEVLKLVIAVLTVVLPPLVGAVVVIVQQKLAQLPPVQRAQLESVAQIVVKAAEQGAATIPDGDKKAFAVSQLQNIALQLGMHVDPASANAFVESAVFELNKAVDVAKIQWLKTPNQETLPAIAPPAE